MSALTRLLYAQDEVVASLIISLIQKKDIKECYYWIFELYYSGVDVFDIIWQIYYDFYIEINSNFSEYIDRKQKKWEKNKKCKYIALIIRNMFKLETTGTVFQLRHFVQTGGTVSHIYRGRKPKWLKTFDTKYHNLFLSIDKRNNINIAVYLSKLLIKETNVQEIFKQLMHYYEIEHGPADMKSALESWDSQLYKNKFHILLGIIIHMMRTEYNENQLYIMVKDDIIEWIKSYEKIDDHVYKNLMKRDYEINDLIGGFNLKRFSLENYKKEYEINWEYYANRIPLWNERFKQHKVEFKEKEIIFPDDDILENFYEKYGFEPDEQSKMIRNMALKEINQIRNDKLYEQLWGERSEIVLSEEYIYEMI